VCAPANCRPRSRPPPAPVRPPAAGDYTNPDATQYFISSVLASLDDPAVDGTFTDDVDGVPDEHGDVQARINMTDDQVRAAAAAEAERLVRRAPSAARWASAVAQRRCAASAALTLSTAHLPPMAPPP